MKLLGLDQHSAQLNVVGPSSWVCLNISPKFHAPEKKQVLTLLQKERNIAQTQFEQSLTHRERRLSMSDPLVESKPWAVKQKKIYTITWWPDTKFKSVPKKAPLKGKVEHCHIIENSLLEF